MKKDNKYSVLMSVYKNEKPEYLKESIESMLKQTIKPADFVLVCDGPLTKELDKVIEEYEKGEYKIFQIIRSKENEGLGKALNKGIRYCKYDIVARMDSDDISKPDRLKRQLDIFNSKKVDMVSGTLEEFDTDISNIISVRSLPETDEEIRKFARQRNPFNHPCMTFRKKAVLKAGSYKEFPLFEDYYLWVRMLMNGSKGYNIQESLLYMRSGSDMYNRRGGLAYAKKAVKFRWTLKKMGFSSMYDFIKSAGAQVVVCIMPNGLRKLFYKKVLRK